MSRDDESREPSRQATQSSATHGSPHLSASRRSPDMHSPPLTPAGTDTTEGGLKREPPGNHDRQGRAPDVITPQDSTHEPLSPGSSRLAVPHHTSTDGERTSRRPATSDGRDNTQTTLGSHRRGLFSVGTGSGSNSPSSSVPPSRDSSPSRAAAASLFYSRQAPPPGDSDDPYAASKRQAAMLAVMTRSSGAGMPRRRSLAATSAGDSMELLER